MSSLLADQDFNLRIAAHLTKLGHDVLKPIDLGWANIHVDDEVVLTTATGRGLVLLTHNGWHFKRLHNSKKAPLHSGVIVCTQVPKSKELAAAKIIDQALVANKSMNGVLIRVHQGGFIVT